MITRRTWLAGAAATGLAGCGAPAVMVAAEVVTAALNNEAPAETFTYAGGPILHVFGDQFAYQDVIDHVEHALTGDQFWDYNSAWVTPSDDGALKSRLG